MIEASATFLEYLPQKKTEGLRIELELLEFYIKSALRLTTGVENTLEICTDFYKKMHIVHNKCRTSSGTKIKEFPYKYEHLKYLQDRLCEDELSIQKTEGITKEVVKSQIAWASVSNYLVEYLYKVTPPKMEDRKLQIAVHKVTVKLLEPVDYKTIAAEANVWGELIERPNGPT